MTQSNPPSDAFNDSLNFVKKLWGQMSVPGMSVPGAGPTSMPGFPAMALPSMSLEDLDKRIQELKTVETWLNVNMTMLRNTIQALEVQRGTIATLHSLSSTMAHTMQSMGGGEAINPFSAGLGAVHKSDRESEPAADAGVEADAASDGTAEVVSPLIAQSAAWWQGVQEQFKQALGSALEKSTANYDAAKSAAENIAQGITPAAPKKTATSAQATRTATSKTKAGAPTASKPGTRSSRKPASKAASKSPARKTGTRA